MNGYFNNDITIGHYTCCTSCGTSVINYLICDFLACQYLTQFDLPDSDHRPLSFNLKITKSQISLTKPAQKQTAGGDILPLKSSRYLFEPEKVNDYVSSLQSKQ